MRYGRSGRRQRGGVDIGDHDHGAGIDDDRCVHRRAEQHGGGGDIRQPTVASEVFLRCRSRAWSCRQNPGGRIHYSQHGFVGLRHGCQLEFCICTEATGCAGTADDAVDTDGDGFGSYPDAAVWIENTPLEGITYRVLVFNNDDTEVGGSYRDDRDGMIWVRCDATGPRGGGASVQVLLQGEAGGPVIVDYTAQAGGGAGNNFVSPI